MKNLYEFSKDHIYTIYEDEEPIIIYIIKLSGNSKGYCAIVENTPFDSNVDILPDNEILKKFNNDVELKEFLEK